MTLSSCGTSQPSVYVMLQDVCCLRAYVTPTHVDYTRHGFRTMFCDEAAMLRDKYER